METAEQTRFREFLCEGGLKFTSERQAILCEVFEIHDHFEAEDIVNGLRSKGCRVSRASVYRTLPLLVESGMLREVHSSEKHSHYEHVFGHAHHDHLVCTGCGRTIDFCEPRIERLQDAICAEHSFTPVSHKMEITGLCEDCARK